MHLYMQVLLAVPFAVFANGYLYFSWEINRVSKSFQVVNIKNACFSKLKTLCLHFETQFVGLWSILLVSSHRAMLIGVVLWEKIVCVSRRENQVSRKYQYGHSGELIKSRFWYTGCRGPFLKYNKANNISSTGKRRLALEC